MTINHVRICGAHTFIVHRPLYNTCCHHNTMIPAIHATSAASIRYECYRDVINYILWLWDWMENCYWVLIRRPAVRSWAKLPIRFQKAVRIYFRFDLLGKDIIPLTVSSHVMRIIFTPLHGYDWRPSGYRVVSFRFKIFWSKVICCGDYNCDYCALYWSKYAVTQNSVSLVLLLHKVT